MPVYRDAGFELFNASTTSGAFKKEIEHQREPELYIYSRYRNPTVVAAEEEIIKLEGSKWALLTQSGMSAIDTAVSIFQHGKNDTPWLFFTEIYGGTISYVESILRNRRGIDIQYFTPDNGKYDINRLDQVLASMHPEFIYVETISNPMLIVADIREIVKTAKKHGIRVIVDNTFSTPALYKPLEDGADIVIHSATKYFSGHGNITAGVLCGNNEDIMKSAIEYRKFIGHTLSADDAYRLHTQVQTFRLRFDHQCTNASKLAEYLSNSEAISRVWYPKLENHETHSIAEKLFKGRGYGAMITFDFAGEMAEIKRKRRDDFISLVSEKIKLIPTLGDPHTILMPVESVWGAKYPEPGMIRLSVGFEEYEELIATVAGAIEEIV